MGFCPSAIKVERLMEDFRFVKVGLGGLRGFDVIHGWLGRIRG